MIKTVKDFDGLKIKSKFDTYTIVVEEGLIDYESESKYTLGSIDEKDLTIRIAGCIPFTKAVQVLLHEIMHCITFNAGLAGYYQIDSELVAHCGSTELLDMLRRNPWVLKLISDFIKRGDDNGMGL